MPGSEDADPRFTKVIKWNMLQSGVPLGTALCSIEQTPGSGSGILLRSGIDFSQKDGPSHDDNTADDVHPFRRTPGTPA